MFPTILIVAQTPWTSSDWAQVASPIIAFSALVLSAIISLSARRESKAKSLLERAAFRRQYQREVVEWATEAMTALAKSETLCELDPARLPDFRVQQLMLLAELSGIIDRGRWFLPNDKTDDFGKGKEQAFQGYRHPALDHLVETFRILEGLDYQVHSANRARKSDITRLKRGFVSVIQDVIDTDEFKEIIESLRTKKAKRLSRDPV